MTSTLTEATLSDKKVDFSPSQLRSRLLKRALALDTLLESERVTLSKFSEELQRQPYDAQYLAAWYLTYPKGSLEAEDPNTRALPLPYIQSALNVIGANLDAIFGENRDGTLDAVRNAMDKVQFSKVVFERTPLDVPPSQLLSFMVRTFDSPLLYFGVASRKQEQEDIARITEELLAGKSNGLEQRHRERQLVKTFGLAPFARTLYSEKLPYKRALQGLSMIERVFPGFLSLMPTIYHGRR